MYCYYLLIKKEDVTGRGLSHADGALPNLDALGLSAT